jgi:hypothetical protein
MIDDDRSNLKLVAAGRAGLALVGPRDPDG